MLIDILTPSINAGDYYYIYILIKDEQPSNVLLRKGLIGFILDPKLDGSSRTRSGNSPTYTKILWGRIALIMTQIKNTIQFKLSFSISRFD